VPAPARASLGGWLTVSASTGSFRNYLGALRSAGLIAYPADDLVALTPAGRATAQPADAPPTLRALHEAWLSKLPRPQANILRLVLECHPGEITRNQLGDALGVAPTTGSFRNYLGAMRTLGLIDYPADGLVAATEVLFPPGLA